MYLRWRHVYWLLLFAASLSFGQQTGTRTITGVVTNGVTGEPIRRALVTVTGAEGQPRAFTGADGRFSIDAVKTPRAQLYVYAQKPGYSGIQTAAGSGEARLNLMPDAKITGRVLDTDGEPVEHLPVQLLASQIVQGRRTWMQRGFATTDEDGSYTLPSLQAGRYLVRTLNHPVSAAASNAPAQVYAARYYPGTPDLSSAQVIQVTAGQDVTIDISLRPENAFRVTGSLVGMPQGGGSAFVLNDADGQPASFEGTTIDQSTGKFTIEHVPSGSWTIALRVSNMHGSTYSVRQDFTVTGNDVGGLQVLPQPAADIPVTLNPASGAGAQIHLVPAQSTARENYFAQRSSQSSLPTDRSLFIAGVPPGSYRLVVDVFGPQCVESASSGSTDLTRDDLIVSAGSQPELILVTLGNRCATLTGRTSPSDVQGVNAFIVAAQQTAQGAAKFAPFVTGQSFTLAGLSPGTYMIYAFSNLDDLEYANPDALREYHGQQLNLQAGQQANVTVDVNQREHK